MFATKFWFQVRESPGEFFNEDVNPFDFEIFSDGSINDGLE